MTSKLIIWRLDRISDKISVNEQKLASLETARINNRFTKRYIRISVRLIRRYRRILWRAYPKC